jgi:hypothetical protein
LNVKTDEKDTGYFAGIPFVASVTAMAAVAVPHGHGHGHHHHHGYRVDGYYGGYYSESVAAVPVIVGKHGYGY